MTETSKNKVELTYGYITNRVFNSSTELLYDHAHASDVRYFPTPDEVERSYPNPAGYSVGMEDGMINGGTMTDACLLKYQKEKDEDSLAFAHRLVRGMLGCFLHSRSLGFVPRGVTPIDRKTCYVNSSIDQYTMFLYGLYRLLESGTATEDEKESIKNAVLSVAKRAQANVIIENDFDILRDDGGRSISSSFWGDERGNHEVHRLPMIYIFAYYVSGEKQYLELYKNLRDNAYERALVFTENWHMYALQQMQASVYVCLMLDNDEGWKEKYLLLMNKAADYAESKIQAVTSQVQSYTNYNAPYLPFRECGKNLMSQKRFASIGFPEGFHPKRDDEHEFFVLQDAANICIIEGMVPGRIPSDKATELFELGFSKIDLSKHERCVPIHYLDAYYRAFK